MDDAHAAAEALREANKRNGSSGGSGGSRGGSGGSRGVSSSRGSSKDDAARKQAEEARARRQIEAQIAAMLKGNEKAKDLKNMIEAKIASQKSALEAGKQEEADLYRQMAEVLLEKMKKQIEEEKKQATVNVNKDLKLGARGSEVVILQQMLHNQGYSNIKPDGIFGPETEKAVKDLQRSFKLKDDGIVGDKTKSLLNGLAAESGNSRNGQLKLSMSTNTEGMGNDVTKPQYQVKGSNIMNVDDQYDDQYDNEYERNYQQKGRGSDAKKREKKQIDDAFGKRGSPEREEKSKDLHGAKEGGRNDDNKSFNDLKDGNVWKTTMDTLEKINEVLNDYYIEPMYGPNPLSSKYKNSDGSFNQEKFLNGNGIGIPIISGTNFLPIFR